MSGSSFFDESRPQSQIKTKIVVKYFMSWANVMINTLTRNRSGKEIAYIDLFSGPGRYRDETKSTPILILEEAIQNPKMQEMLLTLFNDKDPQNCQLLKKAIDSIPNISNLKHEPDIYNDEVGEEIAKWFKDVCLVPSLIFIDPWGYKGLSFRLINSVVKDWGCDCIFFFNYKRINSGLTNPKFIEHMNALFGNDRLIRLQACVEGMSPYKREHKIIHELELALQENGFKYILPFCFKDNQGKLTSHYLIFVSKHVLGYDIMKQIMAKYSSSSYQGVPSFEYNPVRSTPLLFPPRPLDDLEKMLLTDFAGQTIEMKKIFSEHNVWKLYIRQNYKDALKKLEAKAKITVSPNKNKRRKGTFADDLLVTFPPKRD